MAVISGYNPNQDDQQPQTSAANPVSVSGTSASSDDTPSKSTNNYNPSAPTSSGRFTNLSSYLKANSGANIAGQMNDQFNNQYKNVNNELTQGQTDFNTQANQNRVQYNDGTVQNAVNDPTAYANDPAKLQQITNMRTGQYTGPTSLSNAGQIQNDASNFQTLGNQTATEQGRFSLLKNLYDNSNYNEGQQSLDNLLLQSNPDQMKQLAQYRGLANNANTNVKNALNDSATQAQNYTNEALNTNALTSAALGTGISNFQTGINNKVTDAAAAQTKLNNDLQIGSLTQDEAQKLGLDPNLVAEYNKLGGGSPTTAIRNYLSNITPTATNVADSNDYAKYNALSTLAGVTPTLLTDSSLAGTYASSNPLNTTGLKSDLDQLQASLNQQTSPIQNNINVNNNTAGFKEQEGINRVNDLLHSITTGGMVTPDSNEYKQAQALQQLINGHTADLGSYYPQISGGADAFSAAMGKAGNAFQPVLDYANKNKINDQIQSFLNTNKDTLTGTAEPQIGLPMYGSNSTLYNQIQDDLTGYNDSEKNYQTNQNALQSLLNKYQSSNPLTILGLTPDASQSAPRPAAQTSGGNSTFDPNNPQSSIIKRK